MIKLRYPNPNNTDFLAPFLEIFVSVQKIMNACLLLFKFALKKKNRIPVIVFGLCGYRKAFSNDNFCNVELRLITAQFTLIKQ